MRSRRAATDIVTSTRVFTVATARKCWACDVRKAERAWSSCAGFGVNAVVVGVLSVWRMSVLGALSSAAAVWRSSPAVTLSASLLRRKPSKDSLRILRRRKSH